MRHLPETFTLEDRTILEYIAVNKLSMTSELNLITTFLCLEYVIQNDIPGDFIECGTWRGGHGVIASHVFKKYKCNRRVILIDTFSGMTESSQHDFFWDGQDAKGKLSQIDQSETISEYLIASSDQLKNHLSFLSLDQNVEIIQGDVREILLARDFNRISFLRLDTDFYDSTRIELEVLYPKVSNHGFILIDDYDAWSGSKKATDEYILGNKLNLMLTKIDYGARLIQKAS
jgi:O-methyltransferase